MLVQMERKLFDTLDEENLIFKCMEPTVLQIRGKAMTVKTEVISKLTTGQQKVFMFTVLYRHVHSRAEYYAWISYMLEQRSYWNGVINGLQFFRDAPLLQLLEETRKIVEMTEPVIDLESDQEMLGTINRLYTKYQQIVPDSLKRVSTYIRSNLHEFIAIKD